MSETARKALSLCLCGFLSALSAEALKKDDLDGGPGVPLCEFETSIQVHLRQTGIPLLDNEVTLEATTAKLVVRVPDPDAPATCDVTYHALSTVGGFEWTIEAQPAGSTARLVNASSLRPTLRPDRVGDFRVRFTACPEGCAAPIRSGESLPVAPVSRELIVAAVDEFAFPPAIEPIRPNQDPTLPGQFDSFDGKCQSADELGSFQADTLGPAWVTVERWQGPQDYKLLEGVVTESNVARRDAILNHDSQDALFFVKPDPRDVFLLQEGQKGRVEVEWETDHFAELARPSRGDRVSVLGYWIHDCGHGGKTEIHPPVMVATHRARPIPVPLDQDWGSNVFAPGIVTEIFISREAGEATGNCSLSGLHQPGGGAGFDFGPHSCLPQTEGFLEGNPINRELTFTIYLPENPQRILERAGRQVPPVPLYREVFNPQGSGGPEPEIRLAEDGNALEVSIDLTRFSGRTYTRRIHSAWLYAAPDNWGLTRWRLSVPLLDVHDDGDGRLRGDGDWKFWLNTNNGFQEWTRLFHCDGCVHGQEDFGGTPWATASERLDRNLGPDLLLYPGQRIFLQTTGYETDWIWADGTGRVVVLRPQETKDYETRSDCRRSGPSGCAHYTLHYRIADRGSVGEASLSRQARDLFDAYALRPSDDLVGGDLPTHMSRDFNHPDDLELTPETPTLRLRDAGFFEVQELEPGSLHDMEDDAFRAAVGRLQELAPELAEAFLAELREEVDEARASVPPEELEAGLAALRNGLPPELWKRYFDAPDHRRRFSLGVWLIAGLALILLLLLGLRRLATS